MSVVDPDERLAERLHRESAGEMPKIVDHLVTGWLHQSDAEVLALNGVPLKIEHLGYAIAKTVGHDQDAGGQRKTRDGEHGLHGPSLDVPHRDPKRVGQETPDAGAFN